MSHSDARAEPDQDDRQAVPASRDEDHPARRLLAHDLEHLVWDDDGEAAMPPPD
jgi:hypothetical protein